MKKQLILLLIAISCSFALHAQTAVNFNANDCTGNNHDLFTELNAGKIIVLVWVMPCPGCIDAAQTANEVAANYAVTNPGQVLMYLIDDYGNSSCATLDTWAWAENITNITTFSDSTIRMSDYGGVGMPKIVILGGGFGHEVYFNENNIGADDSLGIANAIDSALADVTGIVFVPETNPAITVFPNPTTDNVALSIFAETNDPVVVSVKNSQGQIVMNVFSGALIAGNNKFIIDCEALSSGTYYIEVAQGANVNVNQFLISK